MFMQLSLVVTLLVSSASAWAPRASERKLPSTLSKTQPATFDPFLKLSETSTAASSTLVEGLDAKALLIGTLAVGTVVAEPSVAEAATAFAPQAVGAALAAYGHYLAMFGMVACTMIERLTIKANMSGEDEDLVTYADIGTGVLGTLMVYTGYLRAAVYEKGWDFYSHEPIFWIKMSLVAIYGAATFFNTTKIIQRAVDKRNNGGALVTPMSDKLAARMVQLCNAELVALFLIPLSATFMARGIWYSQTFPWQAEAAGCVLIVGGLGYKYIKEALDFVEDDQEPSVIAPSE
jgi:uncharacterized membrane protein